MASWGRELFLKSGERKDVEIVGYDILAKGVDGANIGLWQKNGLFSQMSFRTGENVLRQLFVKSGGNSRPHFGGGSLCEGDHEKVGNFIHVLGVGKLFYDPVNKGGRLARAGGGGHEQRAPFRRWPFVDFRSL